MKTPLRRSRPELDCHAWLESADAYAYDRGSMEESIAGPVRELDEAVPLSKKAAATANHASPLCDRRRDEVNLDQVERIVI